VIAVKGNQPSLHRLIKQQVSSSHPASRHIARERTRNRVTTRTVQVFEPLTGNYQPWSGLKSLIQVERTGTRSGKPYCQVAYYISSLTGRAVDFARGIRGHWGIENRLHWVKDMVFHEDRSRIRSGNAPANCSIIFSLALNILRDQGYASITSAHRFLAHNLDKLFSLME
jgi:predicted transposase YbfD/YdcC